MKAVVLAGGRGVRLRPLTDFVAKPLLPVKGRPIIEQVIENLNKAGINHICVVIGHLGDQVIEFLGEGSKLGVDIIYKRQEERLGTAHALESAGDYIEKDMLVIASDCILPVEHIEEMVRYHLENGCDATLSLKELDIDEMLQSSTVKLGGDMSITRIIEKPSPDEILSSLACAPLYIFKEVKDYLSTVQRSSRGEFEIVDILQNMIDDGLKVRGVKTDSFYHLSDIGDFLKSNLGYIDGMI